jgi:hypothetical protein
MCGVKACVECVGKNIRNYIQYFQPLVLFSLCAFFQLYFIVCIAVVLYVFVELCEYCCFTLDGELLGRRHYPAGPATGHLDTGFPCFPCVYKRMLR